MTEEENGTYEGKVHVAKCQFAGKAGFRYKLVTESSRPLEFDSNDYDTLEEAKVNATALGYDLDLDYPGVDFWIISEEDQNPKNGEYTAI